MEIVSRGPVEILNKRWKFDYEPRERGAGRARAPSIGFPASTWASGGSRRVINPFTGTGGHRAGRSVAPDDDPLERQPGSDLRGRAEHGAPVDADVGPARRRHPAARGAVPVRAAGAGAPAGDAAPRRRRRCLNPTGCREASS